MVTLKETQNMMKTLYFNRDKERGQLGTYKWLKDEIEELGEALSENDEKALEAEFADVIAWLASLANLRNVDRITHPNNYLKKIIPDFTNSTSLPKLAVSENIAKFLDIDNNRSASFNNTILAIRKLLNLN